MPASSLVLLLAGVACDEPPKRKLTAFSAPTPFSSRVRFIGDRSEHRSPWTPESGRAGRRGEATLTQRAAEKQIKLALHTSMAAYASPRDEAEVVALLQRMATQRRGDLVLVLDKRVIVHDSFLKSGDEATRHDKYRHLKVLWALLENADVDNVAYLYTRFPQADDDRSVRDQETSSCEGLLPELVIAKHRGYRQCGVLVPDMIFADTLMNVTKRLASYEATWKSRHNKVVWRGSSRDVPAGQPGHCTCARESARARLQVLSLTRDSPKYFYAHCTRGLPCDFYDESNSCGKENLRRLSHTNSMRSIARANATKHSKEPLSLAELTKWSYQLNVPFSWRLNLLWMLGSVVLLWDSAFVEWYYPALQHGVTHLAISYHTVRSRLLS